MRRDIRSIPEENRSAKRGGLCPGFQGLAHTRKKRDSTAETAVVEWMEPSTGELPYSWSSGQVLVPSLMEFVYCRAQARLGTAVKFRVAEVRF
jgi:hypothetical protein